MTSITRSNFGMLLNWPTSKLAADFRGYHDAVVEIDQTQSFHDAYAYECARNDRADYRKRLVDLSREINARLQMPEASLRVIREQEATWAAADRRRTVLAA